ncbi:carbohydrate ABC transporter permease [Arthrobacter tecti]
MEAAGGTPPGNRAYAPRKRRGDGLAALTFLAPGLLGFLLFIVLPLIGALVISLFDWPLFGAPEFVGFANYERMFADATFYTAMTNTAIFAFVYTAINLVLALAISLWLNTRMKLAGLWRVIFFIPVITPMVANALVWQLMLSDEGLVNAVLESMGLEGRFWLSDPSFALGSVIVMSVWQSFGYNVIILSAGLGGIPKDMLEAARVDGANALQRLRYMILPMLSPSLFFATTMTMIGAFQVFVQVQFLTAGGPGESTNTLVLYLYRNGFVFDRLGYASALAWVLFVVVMVVTAIQFAGQKKLVTYDK